MRIVVFGAGGGIGGWICEALSERTNIEQVACVRNWSSAVRLARRGVSIAKADIGDRGALPALLAGADVVVNATMPASALEPELVRGLYAAAARAGIRRFIQFSSAAVYGDLTGLIAEDSRPSPNDDYSNGKAAMERLLLEAAVPSSPQVFILRPSIVYGPFADFWTVRYVERISREKWRNLGRAGDGTCNLVHAHDVARLVIAAATADIEPGAHVLNVNGPDHVTWNGYIERLGDALETPDRVTPNAAVFRATVFVAGMMRSAAQIGSLKAFYRRSTGTRRSAMTSAKVVTALYPTPSELKLLRRKARYVSDKAAKVLGVSPSISLQAGIQQCVAWCRVHGIV
jgi:nucleoside-diphosphate-sugar epimerase